MQLHIGLGPRHTGGYRKKLGSGSSSQSGLLQRMDVLAVPSHVRGERHQLVASPSFNLSTGLTGWVTCSCCIVVNMHDCCMDPRIYMYT